MDSESFVRKCFRVQVRKADPVTVKIYGHNYQCVEISDGGVGILLSEEDIFWTVSQAVRVELTLEEHRFDLQGVIVHISLGAGGGRLCGIMFRDMTDEVANVAVRQRQDSKDIEAAVESVADMTNRIFEEMEARSKQSQVVIEQLKQFNEAD